MATFVLVHGAWHGGWCWKRVSPLLEELGHEVYTPTLTGLGERSHLISQEIDLTCHIQDILNVLKYEGLDKVILVGHSYAGMVIGGVAEKCHEQISHLVYLDAFVPSNGQSALDLISSASSASEPDSNAEDDEGTVDSWIIPAISAADLGISDPADAEWVEKKLTPHPLGSVVEKVQLGNPEAMRLPRLFISCTLNQEKLMPTVAAVSKQIRQDSAWEYIEMNTSHNAMVTEPESLTQILTNLAK